MKKYLLVLAVCALTTACAEHDKCYEKAEYVRPEIVEHSCGCHKAAACPCHKEAPCCCHKKASCGCEAPAPMPAPVAMPMVQPKTIVVVVPAAKTTPVVAPEIVYPEPKSCGCHKNK